MKCEGGCLKILKASYYCIENTEDNPQHRHLAMNVCDDKEACRIAASRAIFGQSTCPGTPDDNMKLYIVYRCDGGKDSTRLTGQHSCSSTIYKGTIEKCEGQEGALVEKDVLGCGGRIELKCKGGCLTILEVLYSCNTRGESNVEQLTKVQARCEKKESCMVPASRRMFGDGECPDSPDDGMTMRILYRCDGGEQTFRNFRLTGAQSCQKTAINTTTAIQGNLFRVIRRSSNPIP